MERAAYEASGFVVRRMIERAGVKPTRIVASGGGSRVTAWMAAVADATNLPVDTVAVPEGAALGAAYFARLAAGLEASLGRLDALVGRRADDRAGPGLGARRRRALRAVQRPGDGRVARPLPVGGEGHLQGAALVLAGQGLEGGPPLLRARSGA